MVPDLSRLVRRVTIGLLACAAAATEVAADDTRPLAQNLGMAMVWVAVAASLSWLVPVPGAGRRTPPRFISFLLVALMTAPFVVESIRHARGGDRLPLEIQMVLALRNLGLGLAALAAWKLCLRAAAAVSLFLMLFAISVTDQRIVLTLLGLYSAIGSVWLMLVYWAGCEQS